MKELINGFVCMTILISWITGIVFAVGWWKVAAFILPPYAWYVAVDRILEKIGWR